MIAIKKSHRGLFTKKAKAAGMGVQAYAQKEKHAGGALGKEANFAANAKKWKHGGKKGKYRRMAQKMG